MSALSGKIIGITRPEKQSRRFAEMIKEQDGNSLSCPLLKIQPLTFSPEKAARLVKDAEQADWVVFTSKNAAKYLLERLEDIEMLGEKKVAAVGKKTAQYLETHNVAVHMHPEIYTADDLAEMLIARSFSGMRVFLPEGNLARPKLKQRLRQAGARVMDWTIYETVADQAGQKMLTNILLRGDMDVITFFSPSSVVFFDQCVKQRGASFSNLLPIIACIGKVTAEKAESLGYQVKIMPEEFTSEALLLAIKDYFEEEESHE